MSGVLVFSERDDLGRDLLSWAVRHQSVLGAPMAAVLGSDAEDRAEQYRRHSPERIYVSATSEMDNLQDEVVAVVLARAVEQSGASAVLMGATRRGRSIAPRLAQKLGAGCVSDVVALAIEDGRLVASRYALGGNTLSRQVVLTERQVIAVMPGTVDKAEPGDPAGEVVPLDVSLEPSRVVLVGRSDKPPAEVNIADSERVVCVGRGIENKDDLKIVEDLARVMEAEIACTRPLSSEYGWVAEERMIGISGEMCSPNVLVSLGISGQVQHTVGIVGSKTIVAVNKDANAPIFNMADYGIVGDLYEIVPALTEALKKHLGK